jgi:DAK2 domain fusion protein YloV
VGSRQASGAPDGIRYVLGPGLIRAVRGATANVERHVPELNALNVYPVPDGDTGINMIATMRAALAEVEALPPGRASLSDLASAIAFGALMGARGNSGVILSQVFRGMADSLAGKDRADARDLARALKAGTETAYGSVARPVEGTILSVVRAAADAAEVAADRGDSLDATMTAATAAAREAVARTPDQLDVLRAAGVVDAGGQGLFRALEGALATIGSTDEIAIAGDLVAPLVAAGEDVGAPHAEPAALGAGAWGYETVFLLRGREDLDLAVIRDHLESMGESVLVAGDAGMVKVHIHNARPDQVIAFGLSLGSLTQITIQDLDAQTHEAAVSGTVTAGAGGLARATVASAAVPAETELRAIGVVAIAAGPGLAEIFASFGVEQIIAVPRSGNPSTGEILAAVSKIASRAVVVLPNDPNVVLAAEQAARTVRSKEVVVVPTRSAPEGYAALLAMDQAAPVHANLAPMLAAARDVQTLIVAVADRPSRLAEHHITPGQVVVLRAGAGLAAVADDAVTAIDQAVATLDEGFELLTFYLGDGGTEDEARAAIERIGERRPGTEAEILPGGQPHYRYVISAE